MIDIINHIRMDVSSLQGAEITFYGTLGYISFCIMAFYAIIGLAFNLLWIINKLK